MARHNFSMAMKNKGGTNNAILSYVDKGKTYYARVRVSQASTTYGMTSTESHARSVRAYYPHRRALGQFVITVDCKGYEEFRQFMNWLRNYAATLLQTALGETSKTTLMEVKVKGRKFHYYGILSQGISDQDHIGAMVFSPQLVFMTIKDFNDAGTAIVKSQGASRFVSPPHAQDGMLAFYPVTTAKYVDRSIYDDPTPAPIIPGHGGHWAQE